LVERDDVTLNLDYAQSGLGSEACGPGPLPRYLLQPEPTRFALRFRPFDVGGADALRKLSKQRLP